MKLAHFAVVTPNRCGLYETTRELVAALREQGIDSRIVDPTDNKLHPGGEEDRGAKFADPDWALQADMLISHSGLGEWENKTSQPFVLVAHGRPHSSFIMERRGGTPVYSYHRGLDKTDRLKCVITFWDEHVPYHQVMMPSKPIHCIQPTVDLDHWCPGPNGYKFGGHRAKVNVVCADPWRDDVDPFTAVNAFALWARDKDAKLHMYGARNNERGWGALLARLRDDGTLGEVKGWVKGLEHVYRSADFAITPHTIDTRSVREAEACGCPVAKVPAVNGYERDFYSFVGGSRDIVRQWAENRYNPEETARQFIRAIEA